MDTYREGIKPYYLAESSFVNYPAVNNPLRSWGILFKTKMIGTLTNLYTCLGSLDSSTTNVSNGKQSTVNKSLDDSMYPS